MTRPSRIAGHPLGEHLGSGGSATVYAAGPGLAVKLFDPARFDAARFQRECDLLTSLRHPGIIAVHGHGVEGGWPYLLLERVDAQPLRIPPEGLPLKEAERVLRGAAAALHYAHERGVCHRDVKPANLLVGPDVVKVLDFGLARGEDSAALSTTGTCLGTPAYMAPEQIAGGSRAADALSDQYALGVVLYEMLTGRRPFWHKEVMRVAMMHLTEPVPPLPPGPLTAHVERMLRKNPLERYPSLASLQ